MQTNVLNIDPNLAIFLKDHEFKHYNLVWGAGDYEKAITNMLLVKNSEGSLIPPAYPTTVEMQTQIDSLDYDGEYFWSVQAINTTKVCPGWVISKWAINEDMYSLEKVKFKCFPGFVKASCVTVEYYKFTMLGGLDPVQHNNYITFSTEYAYVFERLHLDLRVRIGPNNMGNVFWGVIKRFYAYPENPYYDPYWYVIEFYNTANDSYVAGEDVFIETTVFVFDEVGKLYMFHPENLMVLDSYQEDRYLGVNGCVFSVIKNVPNINVGMRTPCLIYTRAMTIYYSPVNNLNFNVAVQTLPKQYYANGNTFIPIYDLRIRNDDPESPNNYPQLYLLQKDYREDREITTSHQTWSTYNYILQKLHAEAAYMIVDVQPQFITQSGIAYCSCQILDTYNFPKSDITVTWSHNCGSKATFLDPVSSVTNVSGYVYNRLYATQNLDFPATISVNTSAF